MNNNIVLLICVFAVALGACSRSPEAPPPHRHLRLNRRLRRNLLPYPTKRRWYWRRSSPRGSCGRIRRCSAPQKHRVTVVEVLDPACEACRAFAPVIEQLLFPYPEDVRVVVRFADFHPASLQALRLLVARAGSGQSS